MNDLDLGFQGQWQLDKWKEAVPIRGWRTECLQGTKRVLNGETKIRRKWEGERKLNV